MSVSVDSVLLGDIGATNARFSLLSNGNLGAISSFEVAKFGQFTDALAIFIKEHCRQTQIHKALLAIAGPVKGERVALTNSSWVIDISELQTVLGLHVRIINDFEAVALSLPSLTSTDLAGIGGGQSELGAPMAVLGPGTGLGVACLVDRSDGRVVIASEGGHATLAPACEQEDRIVTHLRERFGHVSAERVISGSGLENIYQAIAVLEGLDIPPRNAAEITKNALGGESRPTLAAGVLRFFGIVCGQCSADLRGARWRLYCRWYFTSNLGFSCSIGLSQTV